jgi:hypothetical protein
VADYKNITVDKNARSKNVEVLPKMTEKEEDHEMLVHYLRMIYGDDPALEKVNEFDNGDIPLNRQYKDFLKGRPVKKGDRVVKPKGKWDWLKNRKKTIAEGVS